ncbi:hypothetical protein [Wolbachia endosymbiont of Frankliniella intonsa]|uniref:hypothetical protein n=1 Tax=Wolbachia endosymbiont of Frankliniella intonsa TaxID=2902422 RepID=UPI00244EA63D|nr:hypothetical protein [Wolbachia endosymbiont of Frankliniella intonsa]WGJ62500.1 hypothetical protein M3L71_02485 [Wolbachia endosymbiont of Frankliniella intonsa]
MGQSLLLNEALKTNFEKHVFIYDENVPTEAVDSDRPQRLAAQDAKEKMLKNLDKSHGIVTMVLIPESTEKLAYVVNIIETDGRVTMMNKVIPLFDKLGQKIGGRRVVKLDLNFNVKKQKFEEYFSIEISQAIPLEQYNNERPVKFQGNFKSIPYPNRLKEMFDEDINSQCATAQNQLPSIDKYKELFKKIGAGVYPFKDLIEKEAHTQAVLDGVFSCYSYIRLEELPENRALVLTEFQTGRGKRIDMLVHGIGFAEGADDAKKCIPIGSEIKGPREGMTSGQLLKEGKRQLPEYVGVMYKSLTDGDKVALTVVVFNKEASGGDSLFLIGGFVEKEFSHSSIGSRDSRQVQSLHFNRKQQEVFSQFVSHKFPNVFIKSVKQGLYLPSFEKRGMSISGKCVAITWGLSQALLSQSSKSFLNSLEASARVYERMAQHMQVSKREEREVFALSKLLDSFERKLDSSTSSLPLNLTHAKGYKTLSDLSNYIAGIRGGFAIHLVTSNHVIAIYRTGNSYAYFDSNVAFISGLKSVDQLIVVVERGIKSANYKVEEKGLLVEHFDVAKANNLLSSEDKQILAKEIKTEHQLLEEQDKELGLIKINGQGLSRVQLYDFGAKFNVEGGIPVLINVDMKLSSKKFQEHLDKKEVSMVAREYLDHFKNGKNMEETAKFIPFEGSKREIEEAEQIHKPKRSLSELVKGTINYILAAVSLSRSESQLPGKTDNKPKTYLNDPIIDNQMRKSPGH